jgi:hypothetical protein
LPRTTAPADPEFIEPPDRSRSLTIHSGWNEVATTPPEIVPQHISLPEAA